MRMDFILSGYSRPHLPRCANEANALSFVINHTHQTHE